MQVVPLRELSKHDDEPKIAQKSEQANSSKLPGILLFLSEQTIKQAKGQMPFFIGKFAMLYCSTMRYKLHQATQI